MRHESAASGSHTWLTPLPIVRALGTFDLDPCGLQHWPTARRIVQLPDDGFQADWSDQRVWLNPPYGNIQWPWLAKLAEHRGTALIFTRTETRGFVEQVWGKATAVLFLHGRIVFCWPDGTPAKPTAAPRASWWPTGMLTLKHWPPRGWLARSSTSGADHRYGDPLPGTGQRRTPDM